MSVPPSQRPAPGRPGLAPGTVLAIGAAAAGLCALLLFAPIHGGYALPGELLRMRVAGVAQMLPSGLGYILYDRFEIIVIVVLLLVMAVHPYRLAVRRQRARSAGPDRSGSRDPAAEQPVTVLGDGRILGDDGTTRGELHRSGRVLREHAERAGVPWREEYETPGGARALLDLCHRLDPVGRPREAAAGTAASGAIMAGGASEIADRPEPDDATPSLVDQPAEEFPELPDPAGSSATAALGGLDPMVEPGSGPSDPPPAGAGPLAPSFDSPGPAPDLGVPRQSPTDGPSYASGSVYTPTDVYSAGSFDSDGPADPDLADEHLEEGER